MEKYIKYKYLFVVGVPILLLFLCIILEMSINLYMVGVAINYIIFIAINIIYYRNNINKAMHYSNYVEQCMIEYFGCSEYSCHNSDNSELWLIYREIVCFSSGGYLLVYIRSLRYTNIISVEYSSESDTNMITKLNKLAKEKNFKISQQ